MTILGINEITRKENFIYYRREFTGLAIFDLPGRKHEGQIEFTIETTPMGKKDIHVQLVDEIDYPVIPAIKTLKEYIREMDNENRLP